jgi:thymidylate synthase ThyX
MSFTLKGKECEVSVIEASQSAQTGQKIITFACTYWRAVHAEHLRHRAFSFSVQSSRAIPTTKLLEKVRTNPAVPVFFGKNQPGMQAAEENFEPIVHPRTGVLLDREEAWSLMATEAADWAGAWANAGYHKEIVNRIIDNFSQVTVLKTATDFDNFYELRAHADAQRDIQDVAYTMLEVVKQVPVRIVEGTKFSDAHSWHLPFVSIQERHSHTVPDLLAMSAARCARTSYLTHSKENPLFEQDLALYEKLVGSKPIHASPAEHQGYNSGKDQRSRNFGGGWVQHRGLLEAAGSIESFRGCF